MSVRLKPDSCLPLPLSLALSMACLKRGYCLALATLWPVYGLLHYFTSGQISTLLVKKSKNNFIGVQ